MGWKEAANRKGGNYKEKPSIPLGFHELSVTKCKTQKKDGSPIVSTSGNQMLLVIVVDSNGREGIITHTLIDKCDWRIAKDLSRMGIDLDSLDERGITIDHWKDESFASEELVGRTFFAKVYMEGRYTKIDPLHADELPPGVIRDLGGNREQQSTVREETYEELPTIGEVDDDNIPF